MLFRIASIRGVISSTCIRYIFCPFAQTPPVAPCPYFHVQFVVQECRLHVHLMHLQAYGRPDCENYSNGVEFGHIPFVLPKSTSSICEEPFAINLALKRITMPLAFFFVQNIYLHFTALQPFGNKVNSHLPLVVRDSNTLLHSQLPLARITRLNCFSQVSWFPNDCHVCMHLSCVAECNYFTILQVVCVPYPDT